MKLNYIVFPELLNLKGLYFANDVVKITEEVADNSKAVFKKKEVEVPRYMANRGTKITLDSDVLSDNSLNLLAGMEVAGFLVRLETDYNQEAKKKYDFAEDLYSIRAEDQTEKSYISILGSDVISDFARNWKKDGVEVLNPEYKEIVEIVVNNFYKNLVTQNAKKRAEEEAKPLKK